jgi:3',5'-cyclic AMP phosphodiesterase CpdA
MQKIIVFTDIHITAAGEEIIGLDPLARFAAGLSHAVDRHRDATRIVITGDLTHHGRPDQYARLRAALKDCPLPVSLMIGNHDHRAGFRAAFPDEPIDPDGFIQQVIDLPGYRLILLDTVDESAQIRHSGYLCETRLDWLEAMLRAAPDRPTVLFMHHPPIMTGFEGMDRIGLRNRDALGEFLRKFAQVRQIVAGHVHRTIQGSIAGIPTAILKSPCHQMPMVLGPASTHLSVDEPGAYGILLLGSSEIVVHTEDFTLPETHHLIDQ